MLKLGRVTGQLGGDFRWTGAAGSGGGVDVHGGTWAFVLWSGGAVGLTVPQGGRK